MKYGGWAKSCNTLKPWQAMVCWYLRWGIDSFQGFRTVAQNGCRNHPQYDGTRQTSMGDMGHGLVGPEKTSARYFSSSKHKPEYRQWSLYLMATGTCLASICETRWLDILRVTEASAVEKPKKGSTRTLGSPQTTVLAVSDFDPEELMAHENPLKRPVADEHCICVALFAER